MIILTLSSLFITGQDDRGKETADSWRCGCGSMLNMSFRDTNQSIHDSEDSDIYLLWIQTWRSRMQSSCKTTLGPLVNEECLKKYDEVKENKGE